MCKGYEIKPMQSPAGWYLGTCDDEGFPNCRLTACYAKSKEAAKNLVMDRQMASENEFCNKGLGCIEQFQVNYAKSYEDTALECWIRWLAKEIGKEVTDEYVQYCVDSWHETMGRLC